jgi:hypothetical protein
VGRRRRDHGEIAAMFVPGDHGSTFSGNPGDGGWCRTKHIVDTNLVTR